MNLHELSALTLRKLLYTGEVSPTELVQHYLERIDALNPKLHALTVYDGNRAMERAHRLEAEHSRPTLKHAPLWGLPFADKDVTDRAGFPTSHGTVGSVPPVALESSPIAQAMDRAGGISLGKTNVPEFAFSGYAQNRLPQGHALNPWDTRRDPGGSSSGAAVAVAARMLPLAPGNDGGGSIRIPAAACGLVGLKPTRPTTTSGLAVDGQLGRSVCDVALLFDGMADAQNAGTEQSLLTAVEPYPEPLQLAWNTWSPWSADLPIECAPEVAAVFDDALTTLAHLGHHLRHEEPASYPGFGNAFTVSWMAGAAELEIADSDLDRYEALTRWLVRGGRSLTPKAVSIASATLADFEATIVAAYSPYDAVVTPVLTTVAPFLGSFDSTDGQRNFAQQCEFAPYTSYLNVCGLPAVSVPVGQHVTADGMRLPIGIQLIGRRGGEITLLRLASQLEDANQWATSAPPSFV